MKKTLLAFTVLALGISSTAFAFCPNKPAKIVERIQSHNVTSIDVTYSPDKEDWAKMIQSGVSALDKTLTINMVPTTGTDVCKISKS